jgi:hypothetical protein
MTYQIFLPRSGFHENSCDVAEEWQVFEVKLDRFGRAKSARRFFLNCTKNIELTCAAFARTV